MSSRRNMKRRGKKRPFIMLEYSMFDSLAFTSLSGNTIRVLLSILRCKNGKNGTKEDPIICPYSTINGNMSRATISKAIKELERKGFIILTQYGGLMKQPNHYVLSAEWVNWSDEK